MITRKCYESHRKSVAKYKTGSDQISLASMKIAMAAKVLFLVAATCTRMSLICFYNRLLGGTNTRWFAYALWASAAFVLSLGLVSILTSIFLCK